MHEHQRAELRDIAEQAMRERGLAPEFSPAAIRQLQDIKTSSDEQGHGIRDTTALLWCSIDNDDSRDLDQLTVSETLADGSVRILVAIADVDALVPKDSPIDQHARKNTTSVYTSARIFPMLPEQLSTDLTSLNPGVERLAMVTAMTIRPNGDVTDSEIFRARVHSKAKLAYDSISEWIDGKGALPEAAARVPGLDQQLRTQDSVAQQLRARRREQGSLEFQTFQPKAVFDGERVVEIRQQVQNRARQLIEEFMIAVNGVTARYLASKKRAGLRRETLPNEPDSPALERFLAKARKRDPVRFPDLSLVIVKLMGSGVYVVEVPGGPPVGHFGLAVRDYTHSTAPNRRFPDLITQRLLKAAIAGERAPYPNAELAHLAAHCSEQEDDATKVERQVRKSEAAMLLETRIGETFDGVITGESKGLTWVRIFAPPAEGKINVRRGVRIGDLVKAKLIATNVERGYIDFELVGR
jgi:exoribonuclease II